MQNTGMGEKSIVEVKPVLIKWARERAGLSIEEVAKKLKISSDEYEKIESSGRVSVRMLEKLAKVLKRNYLFFFLDDVPEEGFKGVLGNVLTNFSDEEIRFIVEIVEELFYIRQVRFVVINKNEFEISFIVITNLMRGFRKLESLISDVERVYGLKYPSLKFSISVVRYKDKKKWR